VARVLSCSTHYQVLGLEAGADEVAVRAAKRTKSLATHPDKLGEAPGEAPGQAQGAACVCALQHVGQG
jgi:curved DNA-binding protein CbpA